MKLTRQEVERALNAAIDAVIDDEEIKKKFPGVVRDIQLDRLTDELNAIMEEKTAAR
jgi:hypothetical protein